MNTNIILPKEIRIHHCQKWNDIHTITRPHLEMTCQHHDFKEEICLLEMFPDADVSTCAKIAFAYISGKISLYSDMSGITIITFGNVAYQFYRMHTDWHKRSYIFHSYYNKNTGEETKANMLPGGSIEHSKPDWWKIL